MKRKRRYALIACLVLIPLIALAGIRGKLIKMGIDSDGTNITLEGDLRVQGGDVGITADKDLIGLASGAVTIRGTSDITGNSTIGGNLTLTGNNATSGTETVTGAVYFRDTLGVTGAATLASTLDVTSTTTLAEVIYKARVLNFSGSAKTITTAMSGAFICNQDAASTVTFTLPVAAANLTYTFSDVETGADKDLVITAAGNDTINGGSAAGDYVCRTDSVKQTVTLVAINGVEWIVKDEVGTFVNE